MKAVAETGPVPLETYDKYCVLQQLWVAKLPPEHTDSDTQEPVGFVQVDYYKNDGVYHTVYIHQISISPEHSRKGIGKRLLEFVEQWASSRSFNAIDLTTFDEVPWNRPYYERLGFRVLSKEELDNENAKSVREELKKEKEDKILGQWPRVAMRKIIDHDKRKSLTSPTIS